MREHLRVAVAVGLLAAAPTARAHSLCEDVPGTAGDLPLVAVCNPELATVTAESAEVTWVTSRATDSSSVTVWDLEGNEVSGNGAGGIYHHVEVEGLQPGTLYYYRIVNEGLPALPTQQSPGIFLTLDTRGLGRRLFRFASLNDMHVGEGVSGQLQNVGGNPVPPSFSTPGCDKTGTQRRDCYWALMNDGAVAGILSQNVAFTIVKGDLTAEGGNPKPELEGGDPDGKQFDAVSAILSPLRRVSPVFPIRGNHDKSLALFLQKVYDPRGQSGLSVNGDHAADAADPHLDYAFDWPPYPAQATHRFIALDTWDNDHPLAGPAIGAGRFTDDQIGANRWLPTELEAAKQADKKVFLYMHHPTSEVASATAVPPLLFGVRLPDAVNFLQLVGKYPNVVGVLAAHTHRNWITPSVLAPGVPFVETAATKEYPGGYAIYDVYEKGYVQHFHRCSTPECLAWSEKTRGEYVDLYPLYTSQRGAANGCFVYDYATRTLTTPEVL